MDDLARILTSVGAAGTPWLEDGTGGGTRFDGGRGDGGGAGALARERALAGR
jgi:hypothetical protein